jgi:tripartite-type tricarboxylate transporter receptor subunit TctC
VINKGGGNSVPANLEVYKATPDGYTLMIDCGSSSSFLEAALRNLPFKVMDRTLIAMIGASQHVFDVPGSSPWKNLKDLEAEVKRDPEHFTWTSLGGAATMDYTTRQFLKAINVDVSKTKPIMCRGGGEANSMVGGGHVKLAIGTATSAYPSVKAGLARAVAITNSREEKLYPGLATTAEQGYPTIDAIYWMGFSGPPKLPSHIVDAWNKALQEISKDQEFISKLNNVGGFLFYRNSNDGREYLKKEMEEALVLWGLK